jgi:hypothetical protein
VLRRRVLRLSDASLGEPLSEVTAQKLVKWTRQIVKTGVKRKVIASNPLEGFVCSGGNKEVLPLEIFEVEAIHKKQIDIDRIGEVRDAFIFQCFTGFAYQDMYNLSPENIVKVGRSGEKWLIKDRGKTEVTEMVPILPVVQDLIDKYKNHPYCKVNNRLIDVVPFWFTLLRVSKYLKSQFSSSLPIIFSLKGSRIQIV